MEENKNFDLDYQYQLYLERMGLVEGKMHPAQKKQLKEAFFGACGQMLDLMRDDIGGLEEREAINAFEDMVHQVKTFFLKAVNGLNG